MTRPLLDADGNSTSGPVSSWALPELVTAHVGVQLVAFVANSPGDAITPPAGWIERATLPGSRRFTMLDRYEPGTDSPYADVVTGPSAAWAAVQVAFEADAAAVGNHTSAHELHDPTQLVGVADPTITVELPAPPAVGHTLVAFWTRSVVSGDSEGAGFEWPDGWTVVAHVDSVSGIIGAVECATHPADGTETEFTCQYLAPNVVSQTVMVAEYDLPVYTETPIAWDVYAPDDPNGAIVVTLENAYARSFRDEKDGPGKGSFRINRYAPEVPFLTERSIVKVRIPELGAAYVFAFELVDVAATLASAREKGSEELTFSGPGVLAYLDHAEMLDRAFTTGLDISDTWTKIWSTGKIPNPVGSANVAGDGDHVYVISGTTRKVYKIRQSDRAIVRTSPALWSGSDNYAGGLADDPADATILWALESPWAFGGAGNTKLRKVRISDWAILATFDLGSALKLTDVECSATHLWTTKYDGPDLQKRSKADGSVVDSYSIVYNGTAQVQATGSSINGTQIALWFLGKGRALIADLSDPETITDVIKTTGISAFGGDWTTEGAEDYFYPVSYTADTVWKYQLTSATPRDPVDGIWRLDEGSAIAIARRLYDEWTHGDRPQQPIAAVTVDFDYTSDSDGNAPDVVDGVLEYTARIGDKGLPTVLRLTPYGPTFRMSPNLVWSAYNTFGTDRSSATFATGKVRFEKGVNIASDVQRRVNTARLDTYMLAEGDDQLFAEAELVDVPYVSEGYVSTRLTDETALAGTAAAELDHERVRAESLALKVLWGDAEAAGRYLPFVHYIVGDVVRVHTGAETYDYDEASMELYAVQLDENATGGWIPSVECQSGFARKGAPAESSSGTSTSAGGTGGSSGAATTSTRVTIRDAVNGDTASGATIESSDVGVYQSAPGVAGFTVRRFELDELRNVEAGEKADGEVLVWDTTLEAWVPRALAGLPWFIVTDPAYGAVNDGATDDLAAINAAIAAWNSAGEGVLYLPGGTGYRCTGSWTTITARGLILGDGGTENDPATLVTMENLGVTLIRHGAGVTIRGLKLHENSGDSGASAIYCTDADMVRYEYLSIVGFQIGLRIEASRYWQAIGCYIVTEGDCITVQNASLPDQGDWMVTLCTLGPGVDGAGIAVAESGGARILNNKINAGNRAGTRGISWDQSGTDATGILLVQGNSIENTKAEAIRIETSDTATFHSAVITGNQFGAYGLEDAPAIVIVAAAQGDVSRCVIAHNELFANANGNPAIDLTNVTDSYVGPNVMAGFASLLALTTCDGVVDGTGAIAEGVTITGVPSAGQVPTATSAAVATWQDPASSAGGGLGPLLLQSDHGTPIVFDDILQASDGADFLYASEP